MNILYILKHDPWGIGGGCYASRNYLELFSDIFSNAHFDILYCEEFHSIGEHETEQWSFIPVKRLSLFRRVSSVLTGVMSRYNDKVKELVQKTQYDFCICDHSSIAGGIAQWCQKKGLKTIVLNHNCEYDYYRDSHPEWYKLWFVLPTVEKNERISYINSSCNIFLTQEDVEQFEKRYGKTQSKIIVGGCFLLKGQNIEQSVKETHHTGYIKLVISGTLGNIQNMEGIDHFFNDLYPVLSPDVSVVITGKNPPHSLTERIQRKGDKSGTTTYDDIYAASNYKTNEVVTNDNITLIPNPDDIMSVVNSCDVFLCPARAGGGIKLRIMDGLKCGLPILAQKNSARGYSDFVEKGIMFVYSTPEEFAIQLNRIRDYIANGKIKRDEIIAFAQEHLCFDSIVQRMRDIFIGM